MRGELKGTETHTYTERERELNRVGVLLLSTLTFMTGTCDCLIACSCFQ